MEKTYSEGLEKGAQIATNIAKPIINRLEKQVLELKFQLALINKDKKYEYNNN